MSRHRNDENWGEAMKDLQADWEQIERHLKDIKGFDPKAARAYHEEGLAKKGIHFFLIQYEPGEVIMAKGTTSDYAALHVSGTVRVRDTVPASRGDTGGCWTQPLLRRLENLVQNHEKGLAGADGSVPGRGALGVASLPLAVAYRAFPELPVRAVDFGDRWLPDRMSAALRRHVGGVLRGRLRPARRVERELSDPTPVINTSEMSGTTFGDIVLTPHTRDGEPKPVEDRFMGVPGTLWNLPRTVTLAAGKGREAGGQPCVMLLIKRKALGEIIKKNQAFWDRQLREFISNVLPDVLARNRLFQDRLFVEDVVAWPGLLAGLRGRSGGAALRRMRELLDKRLTRWLDHAAADKLDAAEKGQIVDRLNQVLARRDLVAEALWPRDANEPEAGEMLARPPASLNESEVFRLNRLLLSASLPGVVAPSPRPFPLTRDEFKAFTRRFAELQAALNKQAFQPTRMEMIKDKKTGKKPVVVCKQGDPADGVFLILNGMVRVSVDLPGGRSVINNMGPDTYFGESAVLKEGPAPGQPPVRTANVETVCDTTVLRLDRDVLLELLAGEYRALGDKLRRERKLLDERGEQMRAGRVLPPSEPPEPIAERLVLTRNVLLIDMHKCTRCDQCVRGCAEAHDLQPRFHRANPELRFGKWEVAGACLHCLDSPCQQVCPVGAITLLEDLAVQIHRDRCVGCSQCAKECPFGVIDMYAPTSPADAPSSKPGIIANKCDLCLTDRHDPPCVACCPYDAAQRVDPVAFFKDLKGWANLDGR